MGKLLIHHWPAECGTHMTAYDKPARTRSASAAAAKRRQVRAEIRVRVHSTPTKLKSIPTQSEEQSPIKGRKWSPEEDSRLRFATKLFGRNWSKVASFIGTGKEKASCESRLRILKSHETELSVPPTKWEDNPWTEREDRRLMKACRRGIGWEATRKKFEGKRSLRSLLVRAAKLGLSFHSGAGVERFKNVDERLSAPDQPSRIQLPDAATEVELNSPTCEFSQSEHEEQTEVEERRPLEVSVHNSTSPSSPKALKSRITKQSQSPESPIMRIDTTFLRDRELSLWRAMHEAKHPVEKQELLRLIDNLRTLAA
ncbi:hypothetical protein T439DRAFT_355926 [Meredithblackwellia eburnea MCA 4105]